MDLEKQKIKYEDLIKSCDIGLSTVILKKSILKNKYFAKLKTKEDYILWLKLAKINYEFYAIDKPLTSWRSLKIHYHLRQFKSYLMVILYIEFF